MGKDKTEKLQQYIKEDRPARLKRFVKKHRLDLKEIQLRHGRNLLHYCCKYGSGVVFRYLVKEGVDVTVIDSDGNTPLHLALQRALRCRNSHIVYTELVLPMLQEHPSLLEARNLEGTACRRLLDRLVLLHSHQTEINKGEEGESFRGPDEGGGAGGMTDQEWRDKLADELQQEYSEGWNTYGRGYSDDEKEPDTYDNWAEKIHGQYRAKRCRREYESQRPISKEKHKGARKEDQKPRKEQVPENLDDIRESMRKKYEKNQKEYQENFRKRKKLKYEEKFKELLENKIKSKLKFDDVPWPCRIDEHVEVDILFCDIEKKDSSEYKKYLREQQIRWHPDKFLQKFGEHLDECDKDRIMHRVKEISQVLNKLSEEKQD